MSFFGDQERIYTRILAFGLGLLFALLVSVASAAPSCYGEPPCTAPKVAHYEGGMCVAWWEPGPADWRSVGYCVNYADIAPDENGSIADLWFGPKENRAQVWDRQVSRQLSAAEQAALAGLLADRPPSLYVVADYWKGTDRPTYPVINGVRGTKSNGRIAFGEPCDCSLNLAGYCLVKPLTVALCERR